MKKRELDIDDKNLTEEERIKLKYRSELKGSAKLSQFMDYYFLRVAAIIAILAVVMISVWQCSKNVSPDISVLYLGEYAYGQSQELQMEKELQENIDDVNGDGKKFVDITSIIVPDAEDMQEYYMAIMQKRAVEMFVGQTAIAIISPTQFKELMSSDDDDKPDFLEDISALVGAVSGDGFTVKLSDTKLASMDNFKDIPGDYLVCMRFEQQDLKGKKLDAYKASREQSKNLLKYLTNN